MTSSPLICEVFRRAKALGWSENVLAGKLRVDRTTLVHIRSGRKVQTDVLSRILVLFPGDPIINDLMIAYLLVTVAAMNGGEGEGASARAEEATLARHLGTASARAIEGFVRSFREIALTGEGRVVEGWDAGGLSSAVEYADLLARRYGARTLRVRAASPLVPSLAEDALKVPLLVVERVEFACPDVVHLLLLRAAAGKSVLATSATQVRALTDERLRRTLLASTRRITLAESPARASSSRVLPPSPVPSPPPAHADAA